jgi:hypothetical protein
MKCEVADVTLALPLLALWQATPDEGITNSNTSVSIIISFSESNVTSIGAVVKSSFSRLKAAIALGLI